MDRPRPGQWFVTPTQQRPEAVSSVVIVALVVVLVLQPGAELRRKQRFVGVVADDMFAEILRDVPALPVGGNYRVLGAPCRRLR